MSPAVPLQTQAAKAVPASDSTHAGLLPQRKCACGCPTASLTGECVECQSKKRLQTKLTIGASNDPLEKEADRVAEQVLAKPEHPEVSNAPLHIQRFTGQATEQSDATPASVDHVLASSGKPLEPALRQDMEQRFGHDFSRVRIHSGAAAEQSARDVNAHAYTAGRDIVFGAGQFSPETNRGRNLLAHELTHVVQQRFGTAAIQRKPANEKRLENDVDAARNRGKQIAKRIRIHTKVSKEVRAKINSELASLEGAAKQAFLDEVKPALQAVTPIEMPAEQARRGPPPVIKPSLDPLVDRRTLCGGADCDVIDALINAPQKEMEDRDKAELQQRKDVQIQDLRTKTDAWKEDEDFMRDTLKQPAPSAWRADQAFAIELLKGVLERNVAPDPRGVADGIRAPVLQRYEAWLKSTDASAFDEKKGGHARGPSELGDLESSLRINRGADHTAADTVYTAVLEYRKNTDPYWLWTKGYAADMTNAAVAVTQGVGQRSSRPAPSAEEPPLPQKKPSPQIPAAAESDVTGVKASPEPTIDPAKPAKPSTKPKDNIKAEEERTTPANNPVKDDTGIKGEKQVSAKKSDKKSDKQSDKPSDKPSAKKNTKQTKDAPEETDDLDGGKKSKKKKDKKSKPASTSREPTPDPEDPQRGVKDALERANQRIAERQVEINKLNKRIDTARQKANGLRDKAKSMSRSDPGREDALKAFKQAEKNQAELEAQRSGPIARNQEDQQTAIRLQNALDDQTYARPAWREGMRQKVWDNALKEGGGKVLGPSGKEIKFNDPWEIGHKPKYEFRKHQESAAQRGITREQFRDEYNRDATHYRPEMKPDNSSGKYEDKTSAYLGYGS